MKRVNLLLAAVLLALLPALQSCDNNDGFSIGDIAGDWATVRVTGGDNYTLTADNWGTLFPAATSIPWYKPVDGQRVIAYFNPLGEDYSGADYAVKVEGIREILTKPVEDLTAANEAEFGNDPVLIFKNNLWIGGGYLNVIFRQNLPAMEKHRVSLVTNTTVTPVADDYIHLEYRYNTYNDTTNYWVNGAVSFNLNSLDLTGKKGIKVKLNSTENGEVEVVFDLKDQSTPEEAKKIDLPEEMSLK